MSSPFLDRLDTNYCPTDAEILEIRGLVEVNTHAATSIDEDVAQMLDTISRKLKQRGAHLDFAKRHELLLAPIRKLPDDVLSTIFHAYLRTEPWALMTRIHPSVVVSHVCQGWRRRATSTPSLWGEISLPLPQFPTHQTRDFSFHAYTTNVIAEDASRWEATVDRLLAIAKVWLARSESRPVDVAMGATAHSPSPHDGVFYSGVTRCLDLLCAVSHRWREAQFELCLGGQQGSALEALKPLTSLRPHQVPRLEFLRFHTPETGVFTPNLAIPVPHILQGASLRKLHLYGVPNDLQTLPIDWPVLEDLCLSGPVNLPSISSMGRQWGPGSGNLTPSHAFSLLQGCRALVSCELSLPWPPSTQPEPLSIIGGQGTEECFLPNLRSLTIHGAIPGKEFALALNTPSLRTLQFTSTISSSQSDRLSAGPRTFSFGPVHPESDFGAAIAWMQLVGHQLHAVQLSIGLLPRDALKSLMECLSSVSELTLNLGRDKRSPVGGLDTCSGAGLAELLTPRSSTGNSVNPVTSSGICPRLCRLHLNARDQPGSVTEEGVLEIIAGRRATGCGLVLDQISRLEEVTIAFGTLQTIDIRQKLEERCVNMSGFHLKVSYPSLMPLKPYTLYTPTNKSPNL